MASRDRSTPGAVGEPHRPPLRRPEPGRPEPSGLEPGRPDPYRGVSYWFDSLPGPLTPRPRLPGDSEVDIAIVGAGFTGLWTAYYLAVADPSLRIAILERDVAGYGASGRNGGWCSALFAASDQRIARESGREAALAMRRAMQGTVDEVARAAAAEGIDCHLAKGGTVVVARSGPQLLRAREEVRAAKDLGLGEEDLRMLSASEAAELVGAEGVVGGTYTPHCAAIHPALLARGLADAVMRRGVALYEQTPVVAIATRRALTPYGTVRAEVVVRATEGYTVGIAGMRRAVAPLYSLMIATEPLGEAFWADAGLSRRETFGDERHLIVYGQRTADGRMAFGGRGAPYHFGSRIDPSQDRSPAVHAAIRAALVELFPALSGARITHEWGGPLGVPRDWYSSVGFDRQSGIASAGGYVGDGVATTNLAGRTLAELITGSDTGLASLPWVGHRSRNWEPEPLRWLGINAALRATALADREEALTGRLSHIAHSMERLLGR